MTTDKEWDAAEARRLRNENLRVEAQYVTKDSGKREEYDTGARRDIRTEKGRYDLLPSFAIPRLAGVYERGAEKYGDRNYEKGIPLSRYLDSGLRHLFQVISGATDEDHAAQAAWNILAFIQTQELIARGILPKTLNDLPDYEVLHMHDGVEDASNCPKADHYKESFRTGGR